MSLDELNNEIYNHKQQDLAGHTHEGNKYSPTVEDPLKNPFLSEDKSWGNSQKGLSLSQKKKLKIFLYIVLAVAFLIGATAFIKWWNKNAFHQDRVSIWFEGPTTADSTKQMKYFIHYKNDNRASLKKAEIKLNHSENFQPTDNINLKYISPSSSLIFLGDIPAKSEKVVEVNGIFYAPKDTPVYLRGSINFIPSNSKDGKILSMENQMGVTISSSPVLLDLTAPLQATSGNSVEYVIDYKNLDERRLDGIQIDVDFPPGFQIVSSMPLKSQDSKWMIGNLEAGQGGQIRITGKLIGEADENKNINVEIGHIGTNGKMAIYNKSERDTRIVTPVFYVTQTLENNETGIINAGDVLKYTIRYQNTGTLGLRDSIVTAEINGSILDFSKIETNGGSFDDKTKTIIWKASDVANLANLEPKASGSVNFSIPVKNIIAVSGENDKNFIVKTIAKIDSPDIQTPIDENKIISTNDLELRLASKTIFDVKGFYNDDIIKNTGPLPMKIGNETTFTLHWNISTVSNDLENVKIVSSLPSGIKWTGKIFPDTEKISYDQRTNVLIWEAGNIKAGTGIINTPRKVSFQVSTTPQINQAGAVITLLNKSVFSAKDTFVGKEINLEASQKTTQLTEDSSVGYEGGKVSNSVQTGL